ncbi:MAG: YraN family protein [Kiritimatiellae bacterium]|nr:YraN family protein [Kiritimatiellia bacterium]
MEKAETSAENIGQVHGAWGESVAVEFLRRQGFEIIERNSRPVKGDARLEIDVVAWERASDTMVFVEVKQHARVSPYGRRLRSIDRGKRANLRRACGSWRRANRWPGAYRFDVVEVYGTPDGGRPVVDHIRNVALFPRPGRFVKWN